MRRPQPITIYSTSHVHLLLWLHGKQQTLLRPCVSGGHVGLLQQRIQHPDDQPAVLSQHRLEALCNLAGDETHRMKLLTVIDL